MRQPIKKSGPFQKPRSKTVKKKAASNDAEKDKRLPKKHVEKRKYVRKHKEYGTSKLEERFAHDFLDKLGIEYIYQFKAESIGRYFDFYIPESETIIEVDGDFFHSYGLVYEEMSPMQKRNRRVDEQKNHWCAVNCLKLIRIWEHDIDKHPVKVMEMLRKELRSAAENVRKKNEMKMRH